MFRAPIISDNTISHVSFCVPPRSYPDVFKVCLSAADVDAATASSPPKIASLIGMEGGHSIGGSIDVLASMCATVSALISIFKGKLLLIEV
jgi:membrane dipeptidase